VRGLRVFLDGTTNQCTLIHELGHHIGLGHGHGLNCRDANVGIGTCSAIQLTDLGVDGGSGTSQGIVFVYLQRPDPFTAAGSYGHMKITVDYAEATAAHITVATTLAQVPILGRSDGRPGHERQHLPRPRNRAASEPGRR
jgi:hypothetical protein